MSVYRSLDEGIPSEVHVYDVAHKRLDPSGPVLAPGSTAANDPSSDTTNQRKAQPADQPFAATFRWVASLPRDVRPLALLRQFPRIANVLALSAGDLDVTREYLFELLIDHRGNRGGFPEDVRAELLRLRAYVDERNLQSGAGASGTHRG